MVSQTLYQNKKLRRNKNVGLLFKSHLAVEPTINSVYWNVFESHARPSVRKIKLD